MAGPRPQDERDTLTVEIVFALVTAGLLAAVLYVAVASPALFGDLGRARETVWKGAAFVVATVGFAVRLVRALWLFSRQRR
ncbi:DUF6332 family protein [Streptomyces violaceusniger]|uniref:DUF6332 family protein n=1 Tax=Streptomyces violaceusniger TaxID=68280 RepID=UPI003439DE65